jgi:basic amino acid/polyamine antiporter, APA family
MLGSFQRIIAYFIFVAVVFLTMTGAGLFVARVRDSGEKRPEFVMPFYPLPLAVFLTMMSLLMALLLLHSPREALLGSAVVLMGLPVYAIFHRKAVRSPAIEFITTGKFQRGAGTE